MQQFINIANPGGAEPIPGRYYYFQVVRVAPLIQFTSPSFDNFRFRPHLFRSKRILLGSYRWDVNFGVYSWIQWKCYSAIWAREDVSLAHYQRFRIFCLLLLDWWSWNEYHWSRRCKPKIRVNTFFFEAEKKNFSRSVDWRWAIAYRPDRYHCGSEVFYPRYCPQWHIQQLGHTC